MTNNQDSLIGCISRFLGNESNIGTKTLTLDFIKKELSLRPSINEEKMKDRLNIASLSDKSKYGFIQNCLIPDIRAGRYDGETFKETKKTLLSSLRLFQEMDEIGVIDDVDRVLIDYYIDAVWEQSDITIEEVRHFTGKAIEWMKSLPEEKRKTSVFLELCKRSSTLSKHLSKEKAMEFVKGQIEENERLDDELDAFYDSICGGESDD